MNKIEEMKTTVTELLNTAIDLIKTENKKLDRAIDEHEVKHLLRSCTSWSEPLIDKVIELLKRVEKHEVH